MNMKWFEDNGVNTILCVQLITDGVGSSSHIGGIVLTDMEGTQKILYVNDPDGDFSRLAEFGGPSDELIRTQGRKPFHVLQELAQAVLGADMLLTYNRKFFDNAVSNTPFEDILQSRPVFDICSGFTLVVEGQTFPYKADSAKALCDSLPIPLRSKCSFTRLVKDYVKPPAGQDESFQYPLLKNSYNLRALWGIMTGLL